MTAAATVADPKAPDAPSPHRSLPHVAALDGLRGVAVAAVLAFHSDGLRGGWLGVDLFFVLSGYLITALLLVGWKAQDRVGLRDFWTRRVRRLGPALVLMLVGVSAFAALGGPSTDRYGIRLDGLATLFEVANWRTIATGADYWATNPLRPSPLRHTWSLSIEEQLYLLWPLAVAAVLRWRRDPRVVLAVAGLGAAASVAAMIGLQALGADQGRLYNGTDTRASAVLLGAALAALRVVLGPRRWAATRTVRQGAGVVAALGLAVAWATLDGTSDAVYQGILPLCGLAGAVVVAAVADRRHPGPLGRLLALEPLPALGRISYGVYLYHWPIFVWLDSARTGLDGWTLTAVRVSVSIGAAAASYRFVEEPIRRGHRLRGRQGRAAVPAFAAVAALALFAGTLGAVPPRNLEAVEGIAYASTPGAPLVLLAGDSVPLLLGVDMGLQADQLGVSVANRSLPGCHLLASLGDIRGVEGEVRTDVTDCSADARYRQEIETIRPSLAMVLFGEFPNEAVRLEGAFTMPCQPDYLAALRDRLDALVDELRTDDTPVVLVTAPGTSISWILERVPAGMDERVDCTNQVLIDLAEERDGVGVVDLASFVCPPGEACKERVDGIDLRPDGLHFEGAGADYINRWLVPRLLVASQEG